MSEKRFILDVLEDNGAIFIVDNVLSEAFVVCDEYGEYVDYKLMAIVDCLNEQQSTIDKLEEENEQLRKIGMMYQGHNSCETCTYCLENKLCCGIYPPILCDEMKKNFIQGLCKKHKQFQKSIRRYDDG